MWLSPLWESSPRQLAAAPNLRKGRTQIKKQSARFHLLYIRSYLHLDDGRQQPITTAQGSHHTYLYLGTT